MGVHICLHNDEWDNHPKWDYLRQGHDKEFARLLAVAEGEYIDHRFSDMPLFRPNTGKLREAIRKKELWSKAYKDRCMHLMDLIDDDLDKTWWIYLSY